MNNHSSPKMNDHYKAKLKTTVTAALLCALTFVGTLLIQIPTGTNGYIHIGDCFVLLCGYMLGPIYGAIAAGTGSALTDIISGYIVWAPGTFLIKALMSVIAFYVFRLTTKAFKKHTSFAFISASLISELFMAASYFIYAALILGNGLSAALSIPANILQGTVGVILSLIVIQIFIKNKTLSSIAHIKAIEHLAVTK